jgi:aromatic ring-opening dioxygenase LigB subunit
LDLKSELQNLKHLYEKSKILLNEKEKELDSLKKNSSALVKDLEERHQKITEEFYKKTEVFLLEINKVKELLANGERIPLDFTPERRVISLPDERVEKETPKGFYRMLYQKAFGYIYCYA